MNESEWTRKLSRQQLDGILIDTKEKESRNSDQLQQHIHKDIEQAIISRNHKRK